MIASRPPPAAAAAPPAPLPALHLHILAGFMSGALEPRFELRVLVIKNENDRKVLSEKARFSYVLRISKTFSLRFTDLNFHFLRFTDLENVFMNM